MTRGFVTVATGKDAYYRQALNMLHSFRLHNSEARFAILCDRENQYTAEFDDVIILEQAKCNYQDKLRLLTDCPYDENIFIETDCLVYRNLDSFWDLLAREWDFSSFGWNDAQTDIWFTDPKCLAGINELIGQQIEKYPIFNPGYLFIRRGDLVEKMYHDIQVIEDYLIKNWKEDKKLFCGGNLRDDPLFCLAMEINGMKCTEKPEVGKCIFMPTGYQYLRMDIIAGDLVVKDKNLKVLSDCNILHFSTRRANEEGLYPWQVCVMNAKRNGMPDFWIHFLSSGFVKFVFCTEKTIRLKIKHLRERIMH